LFHVSSSLISSGCKMSLNRPQAPRRTCYDILLGFRVPLEFASVIGWDRDSLWISRS